MNLGVSGYALFGLAAIVAVLVSILAYAVLRFAAAARSARRHLSEGQGEQALLSAALAEAISRLQTQERAMTARAEASERLSSEIVEGLTSGLIVIGRDKVAHIVNPAARRILKLESNATAESGAAPHDERLLARPELSPLAAVIAEVIASGVPAARRTVQIETPGGGASYLGVTVSPLVGHAGQPHAAICLFTDLTDALALEEQLRLKEALARLGELTAGLAHEFRNGLATIQGYAQLLDLNALQELQRRYLWGIRSETESLGGLVSKFLEFARPEPLTLVPVDLRAVIDQAVREVPGGPPITVSGYFGVIDGDEMLLRRALGNLLRNAVEACTDAGRAVAVNVHGEVEHVARVARLTVSDEGPGIAAGAIGQVFRPFFTTRAQGTGLGLAIVQKVVVGHNGRVSVTNRPEGGAAFRVTLPLLGDAGELRNA